MPQQNANLNATLSRLWPIVIRRRWWVLMTASTIALAGMGLSLTLPNHYRSQAIILATTPGLPHYVVPNSTTNTMEAVDTMTRQILSRARLMQIIDEFRLYPRLVRQGDEVVTETMRHDIEVEPLNKNPERRPMNTFLIAFTGDNPGVTQRVTERLTAAFIEQNVQTLHQMDATTTNFLQQQVQSAKVELDRQDELVRDYKARNLGGLPEQQSSNMEELSGLQIQRQTAEGNLERARQQRAYLQAMLSQYVPAATTRGGQPTLAQSPLTELKTDLAKLRSERDDLLTRYNPLYPDVVSLNQRISAVEAQLSKMQGSLSAATSSAKSSAAASAAIPAAVSPMSDTADPVAVQLRSQLQANALEIDDEQGQLKQLGGTIAANQQRLMTGPLRQQQMDEMLRNYDEAKANYADLESKEAQSELATRLQSEQQQDQFKIIDPATFPLRPVGPHRERIAMGALGAGIVAGLILAFLIDSRDRSVHLESEARAYLPVPLLVSIPPIRTPREDVRRTRRARLEWVAACTLVLVLMIAQAFLYRR